MQELCDSVAKLQPQLLWKEQLLINCSGEPSLTAPGRVLGSVWGRTHSPGGTPPSSHSIITELSLFGCNPISDYTRLSRSLCFCEGEAYLTVCFKTAFVLM